MRFSIVDRAREAPDNGPLGHAWQSIPLGPQRGAGTGRFRMLYYYTKPRPTAGPAMSTHVDHPHHHHHPGQGHPPASVAPSILRMSAVERLAVAAAVIVAIWGAVIWAMA
jgi:hypothetical protein